MIIDHHDIGALEAPNDFSDLQIPQGYLQQSRLGTMQNSGTQFRSEYKGSVVRHGEAASEPVTFEI